MTVVYSCDAEAHFDNWTCPDMTEDKTCGKSTISCPYRGEEIEE